MCPVFLRNLYWRHETSAVDEIVPPAPSAVKLSASHEYDTDDRRSGAPALQAALAHFRVFEMCLRVP